MRSLPVLLSLPALLDALAAQDAALAPAQPLPADRIPVHTRVDQPGDAPYGTWAAGRNYKARFDGGMTFYPQLGRDYPHNQPFGWRTTSVRVGHSELLPPAGARERRDRDWRVEYALGPVVEAYDVLPHGLEQTFVLAQRPAGEGDLCITGALATALWTPDVEATDGPLAFCDQDGRALVGYGRALAIDADGDVFPMTTSCRGGAITLRLPAAALQQADFPLVVDPLLTAFNVVSAINAVEAGETDAATEATNTGYNGAYCFTRHFSATDSDVEMDLCAGSMTPGSTGFYDLSASAAAGHGSLGYCAATNKWVIAYQNLVTATQVMQIRVAMVPGGANPVAATNSLPHLLAPGSHEWRPVVGGTAGGSDTEVLIVYQQEDGTAAFANTATSSVFALPFDTATTLGVYGAPVLLFGGASEDAERPAVNRAREPGPLTAWFAVAQVYNNTISGDDWDLVGKLVNPAGAVLPGGWTSSLGTMHKLGPVVDGRHGRYLVAFATGPTSAGKVQDRLGTEVRCERLNWSAAETGPNPAGDWPVQTLQTNQFRLLEVGGVVHNANSRSHWAIAWRSSTTAPAVYATRVGYRGVPLQGADLVASTGSTIPGWPAVAHDNLVGITSVVYQTFGSGSTSLWCRRFDVPASAGSTAGGTNCSGASVAWDGPALDNGVRDDFRIGCEFSGYAVSGAPANALHFPFVALGISNMPILDPMVGANCWLLVPTSGPDYLGTLPLAIGAAAQWTLPLPETLPALTLHFQDWIYDPAVNQFRSTRRLTVPLAK